MQQHRSDDALIAYLDGELDVTEQRYVEAWLEADPVARERLDALAQSSDLLRRAYAEIVSEPLPARLIAAARGQVAVQLPEAEILVLHPQRTAGAPPPRRWHIGLAAAAGLFGMVFGGAGTYVAMGALSRQSPTEAELAAASASNVWLENAAGYYRLTVNAGDDMLIDLPASTDPREALQKISQTLPQQTLPDLKPWGLTFRGARLVVVNGRPAAQLVYITENQGIGPLTLVIGAAQQPDIEPTIDQREDVNLLYWRHHGRAYALVGQADIGYLWGIANDIAWQLNAI
jgi:anti-sigma factor RsiW